MSDVIKWGILIAAVLLIVTAVLSLPIFLGFNVPALADSLSQFISVAGSAITWGRCFINNFLTPAGATCLSGLVIYFVAKPFLTFGIDLTVGIMRFVYK